MNAKWNVDSCGEKANGEDSLDRLLVSEDAILPTSGFAASVMEVIAEQETAPRPLQFPWKLAIPGLVAMGAAAFAAVRLAIRMAVAGPADWAALANPHAVHAVLAFPALRLVAGPLALALAASLGGLWLARRMAGESASS